MRRAVTGFLAAVVFGTACFTALANPAQLMPEPLKGWTAGKATVSESVIEDQVQKYMLSLDSIGAKGADKAHDLPRRVEVRRDYAHGQSGLRITLNTNDKKGAQLIAYVATIQKKDPAAAKKLAAKGVTPFPFGNYQGVVMAAKGGTVSGAALKIGVDGTLTLEGIADGKPAAVAVEFVKAYLGRTDLQRMAAFVKEANGPRATKKGK